MGERINLKMALQLIIKAVTSKPQDGNLTDSGANISTSGTHGQRCYDYYLVLNKVLYMMESVNPNTVILCSLDLAFMLNPNEENKYR